MDQQKIGIVMEIGQRSHQVYFKGPNMLTVLGIVY